jgi:hypothetical protein
VHGPSAICTNIKVLVFFSDKLEGRPSTRTRVPDFTTHLLFPDCASLGIVSVAYSSIGLTNIACAIDIVCDNSRIAAQVNTVEGTLLLSIKIDIAAMSSKIAVGTIDAQLDLVTSIGRKAG